MITDMSGSAVVVGSMMNAALNKSSKSLVGIIGLVENMPDGEAQRPGARERVGMNVTSGLVGGWK